MTSMLPRIAIRTLATLSLATLRLAALTLLVSGASAQAAGERTIRDLPPGMPRPVQVHLVVRVLDVLAVRETEGEVNLGIEIRQRWRDPSLRFDPVAAGSARLDLSGEDALDRLKAIWTPAVVIENLVNEEKLSLVVVSLFSNGDVVLTRRLEGRFRFDADLSAFPFDRQIVPLSFVSSYFPADDVIFITDNDDRSLSGIPGDLSASDWTARGLRFAARQFYGWSARPFARLTARVDIDRKWPRYFLRIFVPFIAVLSVSVFILWAPRGLIGDKPGITYSALLALAALSFTFEASFPGSMSVTSPIAFMISIGYFYLILALLADLFIESERLPGKARFPHLATEVRSAVRYAMPLIFTIICICVTLRSMV